MTRAEKLAEIRHNVQAAEDEGWFEYGEDAVNDVRFLLGLVADAEALAEEAQKLKDGGWMIEFAGLRPLGEALARYRGEK